jgi:hypothetical protein
MVLREEYRRLVTMCLQLDNVPAATVVGVTTMIPHVLCCQPWHMEFLMPKLLLENMQMKQSLKGHMCMDLGNPWKRVSLKFKYIFFRYSSLVIFK